MIAAESKVADWLAQNDPPRMRRESVDDDSKSIKSDLTIQMRRLKGKMVGVLKCCCQFL